MADVTDSTPLDPVRAWNALHPKVREQIGAAAIALAIADIAADVTDEPERWTAPSVEGALLLHALVAQHVLRGLPPPMVDLTPLGVRQCRVCGCTDNAGCEDGCHWVGADLCSACQPEASVA